MKVSQQVDVRAVDQVVREVFASILQIDPESLEDSTHLVNDLAVDSLDALELALKIQERFGIQLDEDEFARFTTYGEVVACARDNVAHASVKP